MGNAILIEILAIDDETVLGVEVERVGLRVQLHFAKSTRAEMLQGGVDQGGTDRASTRFLQNCNPLDLSGLIADRPKAECADRTSSLCCEQMIGAVVQSIELQQWIDPLLVNEHRFTNGKRCLAFPIFGNLDDLNGIHDKVIRFSWKMTRQA